MHHAVAAPPLTDCAAGQRNSSSKASTTCSRTAQTVSRKTGGGIEMRHLRQNAGKLVEPPVLEGVPFPGECREQRESLALSEMQQPRASSSRRGVFILFAVCCAEVDGCMAVISQPRRHACFFFHGRNPENTSIKIDTVNSNWYEQRRWYEQQAVVASIRQER